jgi:hypothetical protein
MSRRAPHWLAAIGLLVAAAGTCGKGALAAAAADPCADSLTRGIPERAPTAPGGRAFAEQIRAIPDDERESRIEQQLLAGNIPAFLRRLVPIRMRAPLPDGTAIDVVVCAAPDYLAIGSDDDYLLTPLRLSTALSIASAYGFTLPTTRIVDAIYAQAPIHLVPQPLPASSEMRSTDYSLRHNELVGMQRSLLGMPLGTLVAGDKKDLVLTNRLRTHLDRVAIYGWHTGNGKPIQSLSTVHGWRYADYSHGARLISAQVFVNGAPRSIFNIMQDDHLARALSNEGVIANVMGLIETLNARARAAVADVVRSLARPVPPT